MKRRGLFTLLILCFVIIQSILGCNTAPTTPTFKSPLGEGAQTPEFHAASDGTEKEGGDEYLSENPSGTEENLKFIWPVKDGRISGEFEAKRKRHLHLGIDIAAPRGSNIYASHDGRVLYAGRAFRGYGKLVIIESPDGRWATFYSHCQKFLVKRGQKVSQGKVIATVGRTGHATGYHVHFEVRKDKDPINPMTVLP